MEKWRLTPWKSGLLEFLILLVCFCITTGCSTEATHEDRSGSVAVSIEIVETIEAGSQPLSGDATRAINGDNQVFIRVSDGYGALLAQGGPWSWSLGQGTVSGIPPGSGRAIVVDVYDSTGANRLYTGGVAGVTIYSGVNNFTGTPIIVSSLYDDTPSECANFAGAWNVGVMDYSYCTNTTSDTSYYLFSINQTGCDAQVTVEGWPNPIPGVVLDNTLFLDETTLFLTDMMISYTGWMLEQVDESTFDGSVSWDTDYISGDTCNGYSILSGVRTTGY